MTYRISDQLAEKVVNNLRTVNIEFNLFRGLEHLGPRQLHREMLKDGSGVHPDHLPQQSFDIQII